MLTASCVWKISPELIIELDRKLGEPTDTYVNGSQVWLRDDGPNGEALEWRLHPVAKYRKPATAETDTIFSQTAFALASSDETVAPIDTLWEGLEVFAAFAQNEDVEPAVLAKICNETLSIPPDASGLVNHDLIGDAWERTGGAVSVIAELLKQLAPASA